MCGRYNIITNAEALIDAFEIIESDDGLEEFLPHYNISPSDSKTRKQVPVVFMHEGQRRLKMCCWPFLPGFAQAEVGKYCVANAQMEKLQTSKVYGTAWQSAQRCLVPASGFYEWQVPAQKANKQPYVITLKDQGLFAMAGIWGLSHSRDGSKTVMSFAIITLPANRLMAEIHNDKQRMPAILRAEQQQAWLNTDNDMAMQCIEQYAEGSMLASAITTYINNPNNNDEACIKPAA